MKTMWQVYLNGQEYGELRNEKDAQKECAVLSVQYPAADVSRSSVEVPDNWDKIKFGAAVLEMKLGKLSKQIPTAVKVGLGVCLGVLAGWEAHKRRE